MLHNGMKSGYMLEELGWELHPAGDVKSWDGSTRWFYDFVSERKVLLEDNFVKIWFNVLRRAGTF